MRRRRRLRVAACGYVCVLLLMVLLGFRTRRRRRRLRNSVCRRNDPRVVLLRDPVRSGQGSVRLRDLSVRGSGVGQGGVPCCCCGRKLRRGACDQLNSIGTTSRWTD